MNPNVPEPDPPEELRCPLCLGRDVVGSIRQGMLDEVMHWFDRIPKHCRACGRRFYIKRKVVPGEEDEG